MKWILLPVSVLIRAICLVVLIVLFVPVALLASMEGRENGN